VGYHPQVILAGRRVNDGMGSHVASQVVRLMIKRNIQVQGARALVLGLAFKENCPDLRNTRVVDVVDELRDYGIRVDVHDPWVDAVEAKKEYDLLLTDPSQGLYDAVVLAVPHREFVEGGATNLRALARSGGILIDIKGVFAPEESDLRL
jgi:UDP-N-acetyl-D-galactosamine dehydrogenase